MATLILTQPPAVPSLSLRTLVLLQRCVWEGEGGLIVRVKVSVRVRRVRVKVKEDLKVECE